MSVSEASHDPHAILSEISDIDAHIEEKKHYRRKLEAMYEELMAGYQKHANEVLHRPEIAEDTYDPGPTLPDDRPSIDRRTGW